MWSATQIPHILRFALAATTGVPESKIRVIAPDVGGGFGGKLQTTPEEFIAWAVARRTGKPVKYTETRSESLMSAHHGRDQVQTLTLAADKDGTVTGFKVHLDADLGAYIVARRRRHPGPRCLHVQRHLQVPRLPLRVPDGPHEHHLDRRLPRRGPTGGDVRDRADDGRAGRGGRRGPARDPRAQLDQARGVPVHDGGRASSTTPATTRQATAQAKEVFGYDALRAEQKERRERGDRVQLGIGVSTFTEMCGLAPSRVLGSLDYGAGGWEHAGVRMLATGKVEVVTGTSAHGQGHETAFSQIVADRLGVPFEDVEVLHGDTQVAHSGTRHLRLAVAGGRRRGAGAGGRQGHRQGQAPRLAPARGQPGRPRLQRRPVHRPRHRPGHRASRSSPRRPSRGTTTPMTWSSASTPRRPTTR